MKTYFFFAVALFLAFSDVAAQQTNPVMFRGSNNEVHLVDFGYDVSKYELRALDNVVLSFKALGVYNALPQHGKWVKILVVDVKGKSVDTLSFEVFNRPVPQLYLCGAVEGSRVEQLCDTIELRYPEGVILKPNFKILSWTLTHPDLPKPLSGTTNWLEGLEAVRSQLKPNTTIQIDLMYTDEFDIGRKIIARWTL